MDVFSLVTDITTTLLVVSPAIFVLGVTLLGNAIEKSKQEEKAARESESTKIKKDIEEVEKSLDKAKKDGDTTKIYKSLSKLKDKQKDTERKIKEIKIKYNSINLYNTVVCPWVSLLLALFVNQYSQFTYKNAGTSWLFWAGIALQVVFVAYGAFKIYKSLQLIEEISSSKKESDYFDQFVQSIKSALTQYEQSKKEEVSIEFIDKAFPLNVVCSADLKIDFRVKLEKGTMLENVSVWFFVPDGFELLKPAESESWRQGADFTPPNIRTIKVVLGKISIGPYKSSSFKVKTPSIPGKYSIRYNIKGDGYAGPNQEIKLIVG